MKYRRIMIAAPKSGSGKTMITCVLLQALKSRGENVISYKCGPDYIDPMFHQQVIGVPAKNLDTFFTDEIQTRRLFSDSAREDGIAVLEGVMGVFDGLGGVREEGSSYHLAQVTKTPIILVIDAKGMGRSVIPVIAGFLGYDKARLIRGVILNRVSGGYYEIVKSLIKEELQIPVLGYFPEQEELRVRSRHLGLVMPGEIKGIREQLKKAAEEFEKTVFVEGIIEIAGDVEDSEQIRGQKRESRKRADRYGSISFAGAERKSSPVIAVAMDEAFCFYYEDNLRMLTEYGAKIKYFSPIHDEKIPDQCHGLLIGGGYPELYGDKLSRNETMRESVRRAVKKGLPVVAECGGFMYLHSGLVDKEGIRYTMAGVIPATCFYTGRLVRFGYVELQEKNSCFLPKGEKIKGHEFHYFDSTNNGEDAIAVKPVTGRRYPCVIAGEDCWMGFPHLYYPSNVEFAGRFVGKAERFLKNLI